MSILCLFVECWGVCYVVCLFVCLLGCFCLIVYLFVCLIVCLFVCCLLDSLFLCFFWGMFCFLLVFVCFGFVKCFGFVWFVCCVCGNGVDVFHLNLKLCVCITLLVRLGISCFVFRNKPHSLIMIHFLINRTKSVNPQTITITFIQSFAYMSI